MGIYANATGSRVHSNTKRLRRTAVWFAALWPASLHPGFGGTWRTHDRQGRHRLRWRATYGLAFCLTNLLPAVLTPNRWGHSCRLQPLALLPRPLRGRSTGQVERRPSAYAADGWRRHLREGALAAAIVMGISAIAALALFRPGEAGTRQGGAIPTHSSHERPDGAPARGGSPSAPAATLVTFGHGASGDRGSALADLDAALPSETADHAPNGPQGDDGFRQGAPPHDPATIHFLGASLSGGGAGLGGSGSGGGSSPSDGPPVVDSDKPGQQTDLFSPSPPQSPGRPNHPPYIVDPDNGPRPSAPPPKDWPGEPRPSQSPLSAVPEPQTWLMMLFGFGGLGLTLRLKRNPSARKPTGAGGLIG